MALLRDTYYYDGSKFQGVFFFLRYKIHINGESFIIRVCEHVTILMSCNTEKKENLAALHSAKIPAGYNFFMKMVLAFICVTC
jgi:hypothetical protein